MSTISLFIRSATLTIIVFTSLSTAAEIGNKVGREGVNETDDVFDGTAAAKSSLARSRGSEPLLDPDGVVGPATIGAIDGSNSLALARAQLREPFLMTTRLLFSYAIASRQKHVAIEYPEYFVQRT